MAKTFRHRRLQVRRCLGRIEQRIKFKKGHGIKLSAVEAHLVHNSLPLRSRMFGPSALRVAGQVLQVFARPVPIMLVLALIAASEVNSNAWFFAEAGGIAQAIQEIVDEPDLDVPEPSVPTAQVTEEYAAKEIGEPLEEPTLQDEPAPFVSVPEETSDTTAKQLLAKAASSIREVVDFSPKPHQTNADVQSGIIEFITGVIAVYYPQIPDPGMIARQIVQASAKEQVDPLYVASIIATESRFKSHARSNKGALGLMQIKPDTAREVSIKYGGQRGALVLTNPEVNLRLGIHYIKELERRYRGNRSIALAAYNWGPANVDNAIGSRQHLPGSVRQYALSILENTQRWNKHFKTASEQARTFAGKPEQNS
jgi:hypothetical protein